ADLPVDEVPADALHQHDADRDQVEPERDASRDVVLLDLRVNVVTAGDAVDPAVREHPELTEQIHGDRGVRPSSLAIESTGHHQPTRDVSAHLHDAGSDVAILDDLLDR